MEAASFLQHEAPAAHWVVRVWVWGLPTRCSYRKHSQFSYYRTHHCLHVYLGVSQAVFAIKGTALAPGGSSSCLSTAARSWGRFGMPDQEQQSKGHVSEVEGHTSLGRKIEPFNAGKFSPAKDLDAPNLLPLPNIPKQNMALGFLPRPQQWDSCCSPSLCKQSEEHKKCYTDLLLNNLFLLGGASRIQRCRRAQEPQS